MTAKRAQTQTVRSAAMDEDYSAFEQLDGRHPWQESVPEGLILYPARRLAHGKVSYFNFELAKEMGLIAKSHPHKLSRKLSDAILDTFCLRIINEYDQQHGTRFSPQAVKPHRYMATRYLQLQHADKTGRTSGDGRCIWNGIFRGGGKVWDVSSRGTGVTMLAPGAVTAGQPLKSGNNDHGYGCGMAEIDELFGAAISAEIFHRNGIPTERVLAIVDLGKGVGIGVRAAPNLLRPAHMFLFLKQSKFESLKRSVDYFIDRQYANKTWDIKPDDRQRYVKMLDKISESYARFAARLERDYIFAWLDWDGDNVLADAGIIDYGSVRQFGLRHDQYRYDDVERFSTNLNEQRQKAREIVQTFAQLVDYLTTGVKKPVREFAKSPALRAFDKNFRWHCLERFLYQLGFVEPLRRILLNRHRKDVEALYSAHCKLERVKTYRKLRKVADGVHRPAIFNMRTALALMPRYLSDLPFELVPLVENREFFSWILSSQAGVKDRKPSEQIKTEITRWQKLYLRLVQRVSTPATWGKTIHSVQERATAINNESRMTGNALINIVDEILRHRRRGLADAEIQAAIEQLVSAQTLNPDFTAPDAATQTGPLVHKTQSIVRSFLSVVHGYREDI
jgi:uncharacterized protein YdiU (UPF0061 family)